jgi:opacity protein-like surface antigen
MKKQLLPLALIMILGTSFQSVFAQSWTRESSLEFGLQVGGSNYNGELVNSFFETQGTHLNIGIFTRYNPVQRFTFKLSANYGNISGDDRWYGDDEQRSFRNLHFRSALWDFSAGMDINLNTLHFKQDRGTIPYLTFGVSVFKFNPQAQFIYDPNSWQASGPDALQNYANLASRDGDWIELQPIGTEGQETTEYNEKRRYALTQVSIPLGAGVKFKLSKQWTFGMEYRMNFTFTDYLDDVGGVYVEPVYLEAQYGAISPSMSDRSPSRNLANLSRGDSGNKDTYSIFGVNLSYRLITGKVKCFSF